MILSFQNPRVFGSHGPTAIKDGRCSLLRRSARVSERGRIGHLRMTACGRSMRLALHGGPLVCSVLRSKWPNGVPYSWICLAMLPLVSTSASLPSYDSSTATLSKNSSTPSSRFGEHVLLRFRTREAVAAQEIRALPCNTMPRQQVPIKEDYTKWSPYRCMILYGLSTPGGRLSGIA